MPNTCGSDDCVKLIQFAHFKFDTVLFVVYDCVNTYNIGASTMTREDWLNEMTEALRPDFLDAGGEIPEKVRLTCGWPSQGAKAKKNRRIGECWGDERSDDQHFEVFISPLLDTHVEVAEVLVHELVHTAVGIEAGHKAPFRRLAVAMGLEGKMTATHATKELAAKLEEMAARIGPYPHAKLSFSNKPKTQGTRMIKVQCPDPACGYQVRTTRKWLDLGTPTCVCGKKMEEEVIPEAKAA